MFLKMVWSCRCGEAQVTMRIGRAGLGFYGRVADMAADVSFEEGPDSHSRSHERTRTSTLRRGFGRGVLVLLAAVDFP